MSLDFVFRDRDYEGEDNHSLSEYFIEHVQRNRKVNIVSISGILYVEKKHFHKSEYKNGLRINEIGSRHLMETCALFDGKMYLKYIPRAIDIGCFFEQISSSGKKEDTDAMIYSIFFQVVIALYLLQTKDFIHFDLNSSNILITELSQPVKLSALGYTYTVRYLVTIIDYDDYDRRMDYPVHFLFSLETLISQLYYEVHLSEALKDIYSKITGKESCRDDMERDPLISPNFDHHAFIEYLYQRQRCEKKLNIRFPPDIFYIEAKETPLRWMEHKRPLTKEHVDSIKVNGYHEIISTRSPMLIRMYNKFCQETGGFTTPHILDDEIGVIGEELNVYHE